MDYDLSTYKYKTPGEIGDYWIRNAEPGVDVVGDYNVDEVRNVAMEILKDQQVNPR